MLTAGTKFGPYEIQSPLGAGGMGEVYRARDTRLDRTVAIKILPSHLSDNPEARQRFDREARAISSLNHPNICQLYDVGNQDGADYLVMEYLEGETLADRLAKGPLPPEHVLKTSIEICEGLEKAHRTGVIHRDLKPGNIMLTKSGAKLMDFGLAKAANPATPPSSGLTATLASPAASQPLTARGTVVGTFQYMSPEQIEGQDADARSDIFALGAVLYEMATGNRAFTGKSHAGIAAAILASEPPPISTVQPMSPPALDRVVKVCLAKDPDERFQTVHDLKLQLKWIVEGGSQAGVPAPVAAKRKTRERTLIAALVLCGLIAAAGIAGSIVFSRKAETLRRTIWAQIGPPEHYSFSDLPLNGNHIVVSPDGSRIAFVAEREGQQLLWVRPLNSPTAQLLEGTDEAANPFWSPDSRYLGFFASGKLKKVAAAGGVVQALCDAPFGRGGSWSQAGVIVFAPTLRGVLYRISDAGGSPTPVTAIAKPSPLAGDRWPYFLPDGVHFLYTAEEGDITGKIYVGSLASPDKKLVTEATSNAVYAQGYLFIVKDGNLVAQPFDPRNATLSGSPVPMSPKLEYSDTKAKGNFSVSENGVLVYRPAFSVATRLLWLDRSGKQLATLGEPGSYVFPRLSPNGRTVSVTREDASDHSKTDVWLMDAQRGTLSRLTFLPSVQTTAVWSPDSSRLAVAAVGSKTKIYSSDGRTAPVTLRNEPVPRVQDWARDGRTLLVGTQGSSTGWDVQTMSSSGESLSPLLNTPFNENAPILSPDGRWLAYLSNESGRYEVYVIPFPGSGGRWQVSNNGATLVSGIVWSRDARQIYYRDASGQLMVVEIDGKAGEFHPSLPRQFFSAPGGVSPAGAAADGRVLVQVQAETQVSPPMMLVVNWDAELKK